MSFLGTIAKKLGWERAGDRKDAGLIKTKVKRKL
jgi:hypothetical protein